MRVPLHFKLKGNEHKFTVPQRWQDVSLREAYELLDWMETRQNTIDSRLRLYQIVTGLDTEIIKRCSEISVMTTIETYCSFIFNEPAPFDKTKVPEYVEYKETMIKVPSDLWISEFIELATFESMHDAIRESKISITEKNIKSSSTVVAVFLYKELTNGSELKIEKVKRIAEEFERMPAVEVWGISVFFWKRLSKLKGLEGRTFIKSPGMKKFWRGLKRLVSFVTTLLLTVWRMATLQSKKKLEE